ncbi:hypothetical protein BZB76_3893 [Actinomadura pelletieri DSM 43383]|uniref:Uncharacterized protein n=1 Tax=Actinomadura pelletieri DSM 43383 TaxID=1120940 RepID=A0A495QL04_9ACTN|nr:hypothetical protein [Actinomadura pelletieri]RKS73203.1 hypothetical protein BZB76_3893 [Actinomadura pelletieri DSM 43383]
MIDTRSDERSPSRPLRTLVGVLVAGAGFGALTALANALALRTVDLESRTATTEGWSVAEIVSLLLDVGWAWAGLAVLVGWLVVRAGHATPGTQALTRGAAAGALALLLATAAYGIVEAVEDGGGVFSLNTVDIVWLPASIVFGLPLGVVGACIPRPGPVGLLARVTVPVGAALQMAVLPPGRNEVLTTVGQVIVWTSAAATIAFIVYHFVRTRRRGRTAVPEAPPCLEGRGAPVP